MRRCMSAPLFIIVSALALGCGVVGLGVEHSMTKPVNDMIVIKLGGAAITVKGEARQVLNESALKICCDSVAQAWSVSHNVALIHGAGSFGHSEAKEHCVHLGRSENELGFALTRQAVTRLNAIVVNALLERGIPAVAISPFAARESLSKAMVSTLGMGLLPVTHGDAIFDEKQGYAILSGDDILRDLCAYTEVKRAIFVSDVPCVYDRSPSLPDAKRLPYIQVDASASFFLPLNRNTNAEKTTAPDVTGGMAAKLKAAAHAAAMSGVPVRVLDVNSLQSALDLDDIAFSSLPVDPLEQEENSKTAEPNRASVGTLLIAASTVKKRT